MLPKFAAMLLACGAFALQPLQAQERVDTAGPNLVIEVAGAANGRIVIDLLADKAPKHAERMVSLAKAGLYDGVVFHRVIDGFMAQTGDVQFGNPEKLAALIEATPGGLEGSVSVKGRSLPLRAAVPGLGGSDQPDLPAEFSDLAFERGIVGMARSADPNSANSQFFIMFDRAESLDRAYTVVGHVVEGMEIVDQIKRGPAHLNGAVTESPDVMVKVTVAE